MMIVKKDDVVMKIDERAWAEHERLGWRVSKQSPVQINEAQWAALRDEQAALKEAIEHHKRHNQQQDEQIEKLQAQLAEKTAKSSKAAKKDEA